MHSYDQDAVEKNKSICQSLNQKAGWRRLLIQTRRGKQYDSQLSRPACLACAAGSRVHTLAALLTTAHLNALSFPRRALAGHASSRQSVRERVPAHFAYPLCGMLFDQPIRASTRPDLVEPLPSFWGWLASVNLTSRSFAKHDSSAGKPHLQRASLMMEMKR